MHDRQFSVVQQTDDAIVVRINGSNLNGSALAHFLKIELLEILDSQKLTIMVVDFQNVKSISTSAIGSFLHIVKRTSGGAMRLRLCAMSDSLRNIFRTLNLDGTVFEIFDTVGDALQKPNFFQDSGSTSPSYEEDEPES